MLVGMSDSSTPLPPHGGGRPGPRPRPASGPAPAAPAPGAPAPGTPAPRTPEPGLAGPPAPPSTTAPVPPGRAPETEYSETTVAPAQIATSVAIGVILAVIVVGVRLSLWPFAIIVFVALSAAGVYLAGTGISATRTYLEISQGRRERDPRYISNDEITVIAAEQLTWSQVYGIGLPRADKNTRLTVRPGPTLMVELRTGEVIRVSAAEPERVIATLGRA